MNHATRRSALLALCLSLLPIAGFAAGPEILPETQAAEKWSLEGMASPPPWPMRPEGPIQVCVNVGYLIDRDGATSHYVLLSSWGSGVAAGPSGQPHLAPFLQSAAATLQARRFRVSEANRRRRPVFTNATFVFSSTPGADPMAVRARCDVGDLRGFIARAQAAAYRRGNLNKHQMDSNRELYPWMIPDGPSRHAGWIDVN